MNKLSNENDLLKIGRRNFLKFAVGAAVAVPFIAQAASDELSESDEIQKNKFVELALLYRGMSPKERAEYRAECSRLRLSDNGRDFMNQFNDLLVKHYGI